MKEYQYCFVGIPLPIKYQGEFGDLLIDIKNIDPNLEIEDPNKLEPHVTIYYLGQQPEELIPEITGVVNSYVSLLQGVNLRVGKLGFFGENNPRVSFLNVRYPSALCNFNEILAKNLARFTTGDENLPFHPHMTVAKMNTETAQASFISNRVQLEERLSKVRWEFPVTEVVLFGVDPTQKPKVQQKLATINAR
ncbi:2'-5' RNA ligase family protein [Candidatus Daviesbacteria bacterium]|nr:2'-5' RNA ligase family protein [Candidatus Daviesbacteria bacterium]